MKGGNPESLGIDIPGFRLSPRTSVEGLTGMTGLSLFALWYAAPSPGGKNVSEGKPKSNQ